MSLRSHQAQLRDVCKGLLLSWENAGTRWRDSQHAMLRDRFLNPLDYSMHHAEASIEKMEATLDKARRDCS